MKNGWRLTTLIGIISLVVGLAMGSLQAQLTASQKYVTKSDFLAAQDRQERSLKEFARRQETALKSFSDQLGILIALHMEGR